MGKERRSPDRLLKPNWSSAILLDRKGTPVYRPALGAELEFGGPSKKKCQQFAGVPMF